MVYIIVDVVIVDVDDVIIVDVDVIVIVFQYKVWLKQSAEQQFLYGHHVMKSGLGRITEDTQQYQGIVVYSMNDLPLVGSI